MGTQVSSTNKTESLLKVSISFLSENEYTNWYLSEISIVNWYTYDKLWILDKKIQLKPKKNICVYCHMWKKSSVGRSALIFSFLLSAKPEIVVPGSWIRFRYFIFEISGKPSFVLKLFYDEFRSFSTFFGSQFRQKASGWINKTLLLIKQQQWLSEFCVKIDSKN